jgi:hypothetical protein
VRLGAGRREIGGDFRNTPGAVSQDSLSVDQLLSALQRKGIPLPFEIGTFLVLQAAEQALVLEATEEGMAAPPRVAMSDVWLSEDGAISVEPSHSARTEMESCRSLVELLGDLLVRSAPGVPPMLLELVEHGPSDGEWTLMRLRDDLEASLVPLNRGALRRVLARLLREVRRELERAPAAPAPDVRSVDRDLDALLGVERDYDAPNESTPPPSYGAELDRAAPSDEPFGEGDQLEEAPTQRRSRSDPALAPRARARRSARREQASLELDQFEDEEKARSSGGARIGLALVLLAAVFAVGYLAFGRERARSALGLPAAGSAPAAGAKPAERKEPAARYGELRVTSSPERAQVLLFAGVGPVVIPDLPAGVAHEFVALADGKAPSRAVVPADAVWQADGARRRYEIALQLDDAGPRRPAADLGDTRLPAQVGAPNGTLGDVRAVTSPPGARVYQLVGFTPDVLIQNVRIDEPLELLVYLGGHQLKRLAISPADWKPVDGKLVAALDVELARR